MYGEYAAGASAARWKLAAFLLQYGIYVRSSRWSCPPSNEDFLEAIIEAIRSGRIR